MVSRSDQTRIRACSTDHVSFDTGAHFGNENSNWSIEKEKQAACFKIWDQVLG